MQTWTEDRIEKLTQLWAEGLSASQIAAELGGVSRNAVIGKVHRLGLASRKTTRTAVGRRSVWSDSDKTVARPIAARAVAPIMRSNAAVARKVKELPAIAQPAAEIIPIFPRVTLMELGPSTCRWPIGDPMSADFRFCGAKTENGATYCGYHACLAYQPRGTQDRQRRAGGRR